MPSPDRLMTDRSSYISYLEAQLERVSAACLTVQVRPVSTCRPGSRVARLLLGEDKQCPCCSAFPGRTWRLQGIPSPCNDHSVPHPCSRLTSGWSRPWAGYARWRRRC